MFNRSRSPQSPYLKLPIVFTDTKSANEKRNDANIVGFSHDVTKIQTTKVSILLRFQFHRVLEQLKTNFQTNFRFKRGLGFVTEYA